MRRAISIRGSAIEAMPPSDLPPVGTLVGALLSDRDVEVLLERGGETHAVVPRTLEQTDAPLNVDARQAHDLQRPIVRPVDVRELRHDRHAEPLAHRLD